MSSSDLMQFQENNLLPRNVMMVVSDDGSVAALDVDSSTIRSVPAKNAQCLWSRLAIGFDVNGNLINLET